MDKEKKNFFPYFWEYVKKIQNDTLSQVLNEQKSFDSSYCREIHIVRMAANSSIFLNYDTYITVNQDISKIVVRYADIHLPSLLFIDKDQSIYVYDSLSNKFNKNLFLSFYDIYDILDCVDFDLFNKIKSGKTFEEILIKKLQSKQKQDEIK
jgi:hypothetical protein